MNTKLNYSEKQIYLDLGRKGKSNFIRKVWKYQRAMGQSIKLKKYRKFGQDFKWTMGIWLLKYGIKYKKFKSEYHYVILQIKV